MALAELSVRCSETDDPGVSTRARGPGEGFTEIEYVEFDQNTQEPLVANKADMNLSATPPCL